MRNLRTLTWSKPRTVKHWPWLRGQFLRLVPRETTPTLRLEAIHSVIFGGFSGQSCGERIADSGSRILVTMDSD